MSWKLRAGMLETSAARFDLPALEWKAREAVMHV